jgi:hypothetical protein
MNVQKYWTQLLAAFGDVTGARNLDQFQKKHIAAVSPSAKVETVTAANVITASETGKTFFQALAGGFASTLPAPAAGLKYRFVVSVSPTTAYTIVTNGSANIIKGGTIEIAGTASPYINNGDLITFVANTAVVGDWVELVSDGTSWFLSGMSSADGGITLGST